MAEMYETKSGENILYMDKVSPYSVSVVTEDYEQFYMDPILSKVVGGMCEVYIEELPEYQAASVGETFYPRRN